MQGRRVMWYLHVRACMRACVREICHDTRRCVRVPPAVSSTAKENMFPSVDVMYAGHSLGAGAAAPPALRACNVPPPPPSPPLPRPSNVPGGGPGLPSSLCLLLLCAGSDVLERFDAILMLPPPDALAMRVEEAFTSAAMVPVSSCSPWSAPY